MFVGLRVCDVLGIVGIVGAEIEGLRRFIMLWI